MAGAALRESVPYQAGGLETENIRAGGRKSLPSPTASSTALPKVEVFSDIHCVTTWSRYNNTWEGVSTATIKDLARIKPEAKYVMVQGEGGFTTNLPLEDFFQEDALFALKHDGQPLTAEHGGPVRLVVPRLYFWKSAKWVTGIKFQAENEPGFWERAGYHMHGDPWTEERYGGR